MHPEAARSLRLLLAAVLLPALFVGGPDSVSPRVYQAIWNLGHPVLFALLGYEAAVRAVAWRASRLWRILGFMLVATVLAAGIEWAQGAVGRQQSLGDIVNSLLGALIGLVIAAPARPNFHPGGIHAVRVGLVVALAAPMVLPVARTLVDGTYAHLQFPVLSDLSAPLALSRWGGPGGQSVVHGFAGAEGPALRLDLQPARYAGFTLKHFPRDWRGHQALEIRLHSETTHRLTCRLNDRAHEYDNRYEDRYNGAFGLQPGWQTLRINLDKVAAAPRERRMNLADMTRLVCFIGNLETPTTLHVDFVQLVP
jgi:VanZ family protein